MNETEVLRAEVALLDAALEAVLLADSLDVAQGIAHAATNREEYHLNVQDEAN